MNAPLTPEQLKELDLLRRIARWERRNRLQSYKPYPRQFEFHEAGATFRERLLGAGNQLGKTFGGGYEGALHATGQYPDWWRGMRFDKPVTMWTGSATNETSKSILQPILLGVEEPNDKHPDWGTGALPASTILHTSTRIAGVKGVLDHIEVKHVSGGTSRIEMKTYEQCRFKWQGKPVDVVWFDEEPPADIYSEGVTRTNTTNGIVYTTFTPLLGLTRVVEQFYEPKPGDPPRHLTNMTIYDCIGGTWGRGTPWEGQAWTGHYTQERADEIVLSYPAHEREARANGVPMAGEGRVFPVDEEAIKVQPFEIPNHWPLIFGLDFGVNHPAAGALLAWDRHNDIVYVIDCYRMAGQTPAYHATWFNAAGREWIPVSWPHDGLNTEKSSGRTLADHYRQHRVNMLAMSARYHDETGGRQDAEPAFEEMLERMLTGRFKVFVHLRDWFEEFRNLHRKDGKIVPVKDDIIKSTQYAYMMRRYARTLVSSGRAVQQKYRPIVA